MNENQNSKKDQPLFASLTLHDGRVIKIYGHMPAVELKKLMDVFTKQVQDDPNTNIPDVYNQTHRA